MPTREISVEAPSDLHEILLAELAALGFEAFTSDGNRLRAYRQVTLGTPAETTADSERTLVADLLARYGIAGPPACFVHEDRNWNAEWEASIRPVRVGGFLIAPEWDLSDPAFEATLIRINPKMSFGTGHHESTRLALRLLEECVRPGDVILDAGTGTGILAIAAVKLGASRAVAFDTDASVEENFRENARLNGVADRVAFVTGTLEQVPPEAVDVLVANINRNALIEYLEQFERRLSPGGVLILSGLLVSDRSTMIDTVLSRHLKLGKELVESEWWSCSARKETEENHV